MIKGSKLLKSALAVLMAVSCVAITACGKTTNGGAINSGSDEPNTAETDKDNTEDTSTPSDQTDITDGGSSISVDSDGNIRVSSTEEFLEAIKPGAYIAFEPGFYNLSEYIQNELDITDWNAKHTYVKFRDNFDGYEMVVQDASGIHISGGSDRASDTEVVIEPRYACVICFIGCDDIEVSNITMGHTETGECVGNVLDFDYCRNINLNNVDLYGCGVYGIGSYNQSGNLYVKDSIIRDCSSGPFAIDSPTGEFVFENCSFTGSNWGGYISYEEDVTPKFIKCKFGQAESNTWSFDNYCEFVDCDMMEPTEYPDIEEGL